MKRYRLLGFDFDTRARLLEPIREEWAEEVKAAHRRTQEGIIQGLREEFGERDFEQKLQNFKDLGARPFSVIAYHNAFFAQARAAFVGGQYYPALTGVTALGERVLNHLVLGLRDHYTGSAIFRRVHRKDSFDNWYLAIDALHEWQVLTEDAEAQFRELAQRRNEALHFNPDTAPNVRALALDALLQFGRIINAQFACFGAHPWLFTPPGEVYIRREWESVPFIQLVYAPNAVRVGFRHRVVSAYPWRIEDADNYEDREVDDEEFTRLRVEFQNAA